VLPLSVETWKVTVPVGTTPPTPETVTEPVIELPKVRLEGFSVGIGTVGLNIRVYVAIAELPFASVTFTVFGPGLVACAVKTKFENVPIESVDGFEGKGVTATPFSVTCKLELAAKPFPDIVTMPLFRPEIGVIIIDGVTLKLALAELMPSLAKTG
jgi:hypothetical protein